MAKRRGAYQGAKRQKEKARQARQEEKRRRRQERRQRPLAAGQPEPGAEGIPPEPPDESTET
jgi:hypothetical protein